MLEPPGSWWESLIQAAEDMLRLSAECFLEIWQKVTWLCEQFQGWTRCDEYQSHLWDKELLWGRSPFHWGEIYQWLKSDLPSIPVEVQGARINGGLEKVCGPKRLQILSALSYLLLLLWKYAIMIHLLWLWRFLDGRKLDLSTNCTIVNCGKLLKPVLPRLWRKSKCSRQVTLVGW